MHTGHASSARREKRTSRSIEGWAIPKRAHRTGHEFVRARPRARKKSPPKNFYWGIALALPPARPLARRRGAGNFAPALSREGHSWPARLGRQAGALPTAVEVAREAATAASRRTAFRSTGSATALELAGKQHAARGRLSLISRAPRLARAFDRRHNPAPEGRPEPAGNGLESGPGNGPKSGLQNGPGNGPRSGHPERRPATAPATGPEPRPVRRVTLPT